MLIPIQYLICFTGSFIFVQSDVFVGVSEVDHSPFFCFGNELFNGECMYHFIRRQKDFMDRTACTGRQRWFCTIRYTVFDLSFFCFLFCQQQLVFEKDEPLCRVLVFAIFHS